MQTLERGDIRESRQVMDTSDGSRNPNASSSHGWRAILGIDRSEHGDLVFTPLVFNTFVFTQIFNHVSYRGLDNRLNIPGGIFRNMYLIMIMLIGKSLPFKF